MPQWNLPGTPDLSLVDRIPWVELTHAYGSAVDVPEQLRSLLSSEPERRRKAIYSFSCNLFHQGTVYPATIPAIDVLVDLLRYRDVPEKSKILETLLMFAVGFSDEQEGPVDIEKFVGLCEDDEEDARCTDTDCRECYLRVAASVPLFEALLADSDPRTAIMAAHILAFFPAHAFASSRRLLDVARDDDRHDFVRSSALFACSYLRGGAVNDEYLQALSAMIEGHDPAGKAPLPLLPATAVWCLLRQRKSIGENVRQHVEALRDRCLNHDVVLPKCDFYTFAEPSHAGDVDNYDVRALLMPEPQFPWGSLVARLQKFSSKRSPILQKMRVQRQARNNPNLPVPESFEVIEGDFSRENVIRAVRRFHASLIGERNSIIQETECFKPFRSHALSVWDSILELLDSDEKQVRWAAASLIEVLEALDESKVDQLIDRLHANNNSSLGRVIAKQKVTATQCQQLCDRLCDGTFVRDEPGTNRDQYRSILLRHGTPEQLWKLYDQGELEERCLAFYQLRERGIVDAADPRGFAMECEDLFSDNYGRMVSARFTFAKSAPAQDWFFNSFAELSNQHRWAVIEAMSLFGADLSDREDQLIARIRSESQPVLKAKLIGLFKNFESVDVRLVDVLAGLITENATSLEKVAAVEVLGQWSGNADVGAVAASRLKSFLGDPSPRVRHSALEQIAENAATQLDHEAIYRQVLADADPDNVRLAMWHLARIHRLSQEDGSMLLSRDQTDRLRAETLLAVAVIPDQADANAIPVPELPEEGPLVASVRQWSQQFRSPR